MKVTKYINSDGIQEYRYSVADVVFIDVGDVSVPSEYEALFHEYCNEIDVLPVDTPMWRTSGSGYKSCILEKSRHKAYTKSLLCSGDDKKMEAGKDAMLNQLGRYYESDQQEKLFKECRKNFVLMRERK